MSELAAIPLPTLDSLGSVNPRAEMQQLHTSDGTTIACRHWLGGVRKPVLVYLHGIEGHGQWFEHTANVLNQHGFSIYAPDRRGAGLNAAERGHLPSFKRYLADIEQLLAQVQLEHPGSAIVLFGNCWGAKAAAVMASKNYVPVGSTPMPRLAGLILTCPALYTKVDFDLKTKLSIARDIIFGGDRQKRNIQIPIATRMFTDNPEFLHYLETDSLRLKQATSRFYFENFLLTLKARQTAKNLEMPVLLVLTDKDEIVDFDKIETWFEQVPSGRKSMFVYPDASHSIDFDQKRFPDYIKLLINWLDSVTVTT